MTEHNQRRLAAVLAVIAAAMAACVWRFCLRRPPDRELSFRPLGDTRLSGVPLALDLNDATAEELEGLPGIGPVLAEAILARREELGAFQTEEDVLSVPGIGRATYEKILPYITY